MPIISRFPSCCTSLIFSNIPSATDTLRDPNNYSEEHSLSYLIADGDYYDKHYCNIHAILTDDQVERGRENVLLPLGFQEVNSSKKHRNGGEIDTGNLRTYISDWRLFKKNIRKTLDFKIPLYFPIAYPIQQYRIPQFHAVLKSADFLGMFKYYADRHAYSYAYKLICDIVGMHSIYDGRETNKHLIQAARLPKSWLSYAGWDGEPKGEEFWQWASDNLDVTTYKACTDFLITHYQLPFPKYCPDFKPKEG